VFLSKLEAEDDVSVTKFFISRTKNNPTATKTASLFVGTTEIPKLNKNRIFTRGCPENFLVFSVPMSRNDAAIKIFENAARISNIPFGERSIVFIKHSIHFFIKKHEKCFLVNDTSNIIFDTRKMSISWGNSLSVKKKPKEAIPDKLKLWTDLTKPKTTNDLIGNDDARKQMNDWFIKIKNDNSNTNKCLLVIGQSGVGKSISVNLISKANGLTTLETYGNIPRTPQKMESLFRELSIIGTHGVLVLDDAESFLKETTVVKPLTRLFKNNEMKNGNRVICVIICNTIDKSMNTLRDCCDVIEFKALQNKEIYSIFRNLSKKVLKICYIPPMAAYLVSTHTTGNITQAVNQMQFMYQNTPFPVLKKKKSNKKMKLDQSSKSDNPFQMWVSTYKQSNIKCFIDNKDINLLEAICNMNKSFLDNIGDNLFKEYIRYFNNDTVNTLESISKCIDSISASDIKRPKFDEDRLYDSENSERWSEDDTNFLICIYSGIQCIRGRDKYEWTLKKRRRKKFKFID